MVELVVVAHGNFASALRQTAEMLVGEQTHISTFGLCLGESVDELREKVAEAIEMHASQGEVLVLTDMVSGSPFNVAASLMQRFEFEHLSGINFPMFIEILSSRDESSAKELVEMALTQGKETIVDAKKYFEEVE